MKRDQDVQIPYSNSRRIEWDIDDVTGPDAGGPTNLTGYTVEFNLYENSRQRDGTPILSFTDSDAQLRIDEPTNGIVSLYVGSAESTLDVRSGRYYLSVIDPIEGDEWTVATGAYTITR